MSSCTGRSTIDTLALFCRRSPVFAISLSFSLLLGLGQILFFLLGICGTGRQIGVDIISIIEIVLGLQFCSCCRNTKHCSIALTVYSRVWSA